MTLTIEAAYENGVLKPAVPLPLKEHEKVTVTIQPAISPARQTAGIVPWTGWVEDLDYLIEDVDNDFLEGP
jgi:predicted DNA-binding antitoxin AbrB/MazE fold protein